MIYKLICAKNRLSVDKFFRLSPSGTRGGPLKIEFSTEKKTVCDPTFHTKSWLDFSKILQEMRSAMFTKSI
ncbi:hypothetical protein Y032_0838g2610 [Ancylostoma ceylanicum]|uniref:Uncharacterized protein n=1 Tax=Ancylostoma ceylanicum TaxID=53326 RepID=A0A016WDA4_9BILA|nr:hypothetical protein Y032_0838g2610 [Ancylostoma ceylanicum]